LPQGPGARDIVASRTTARGDAITVERSPRYPVWITAFDGEDTVGLGLTIREAMWLMASLQVAVDGPSGERPIGPPRLEVLRTEGPPLPRRGPLGRIGKPRLVE
jgi:hypothetical protein